MAWLLFAAVALPVLALWSRLPNSRPVTDALRARGMAGPILSLLLNVSAVAGLGFVVPFFLQQALGADSSVTGFTVLALPLGMAATSTLGGYIADRWDANRMTLIGTLVIAVGLVLASPLTGSWHPLDLAWRLGLAGVGLGLFAGPNMALAMQQAPRHMLATVGALTSLARSLAFALGPALATIPFALSAYTDTGMRRAAILSLALVALAVIGKVVSVTRGRAAASEPPTLEIEQRAA
jgi:MFS family permease